MNDETDSFITKQKNIQISTGMRETAGSKTEKVPEFLCIGSKSSKFGWCTEILIRLILAVIFGLSALFIEPFLRYVEVHDWPRYNYPHAEPESIHPAVVFGVIVAVPIILICIVSIAGTGFWAKKYERNKVPKDKIKQYVHRRILTEWLLLILATTMAYLLNGVITDVIKNTYGRPRPDFLSRCFAPDNQDFRSGGNKGNLWVTLPSRTNNGSNTDLQLRALAEYGTSTGQSNVPFPYIEDVKAVVDYKDCINQDDDFLRRGGRRSFPSGHTSFSFAGATLCALYSFYWLGKFTTDIKMMSHVQLPGLSLRLTALFIWFLPAIYVGISRTQDYRHHPGDVFAGAFIGIVTTYFSFIQYFEISLFPVFKSKTGSSLGSYSRPPSTEQTNSNNETNI